MGRDKVGRLIKYLGKLVGYFFSMRMRSAREYYEWMMLMFLTVTLSVLIVEELVVDLYYEFFFGVG